MPKPQLRAVPTPEDAEEQVSEEPEEENEDEQDEDENEDEDEAEGPETLVESWETDNEELVIELHDDGKNGPDQVLAIGGSEEDGDEPAVVALAFGVKELDEVIGMLNECRESMAHRAKMKRKGKPT
jgi:hypothetical protein